MNINRMERPNILFILTDQLRRTGLGCYGNPDVRTPNIDGLCREGLQFHHCISASPVCAPYRATIQSGLYPHQHGVRGNGDLFCPHFKGLADYFNEAGYDTCFVGKSHFGLDEIEEKDGWVRPENRMGWKHWYGTGGDHHYDTPIYDMDGNCDTQYFGQYGAEVRTNIAADFIRQSAGQPWLLQLNYREPHVATMPDLYKLPATREYVRMLNQKFGFGLTEDILRNPNPLSFYDTVPQHLLTQLLPQKYLDRYDSDRLQTDPNVPEGYQRLTQLFLKEYYAMISCVDDEIGKVIGVLREKNQLDKTIILFTSDHGDMLCHGYLRFKGVPYQNAYRTPMIVRGPGVPVGTTNELINSVDILPTLLELAGIMRPDNLPGVSVAPAILNGETGLQKDLLLGLASWRGLYDGKYFYAMDNRSGKMEPVKLIDVAADPYDMHNLLDHAEYQKLQKYMRQRLIQRLQDVGDYDFLEKPEMRILENQ